MNGHRLAEETIPSRSAVGLNERLATPLAEDHRSSRHADKLRRHLRRFNVVATPAVIGTTVAWGTNVAVRQVLGAQDLGPVPPSTILLIAYISTLALSLPLAYLPKRAHGMHAALATFLGVTLALAYSYSEYQSWTWAKVMGSSGMRELAAKNVGAIGLYVLVMGIVWLPALLATYHGRKTLAERLRETKPNG
jgi:hypothetical protein